MSHQPAGSRKERAPFLSGPGYRTFAAPLRAAVHQCGSLDSPITGNATIWCSFCTTVRAVANAPQSWLSSIGPSLLSTRLRR